MTNQYLSLETVASFETTQGVVVNPWGIIKWAIVVVMMMIARLCWFGWMCAFSNIPFIRGLREIRNLPAAKVRHQRFGTKRGALRFGPKILYFIRGFEGLQYRGMTRLLLMNYSRQWTWSFDGFPPTRSLFSPLGFWIFLIFPRATNRDHVIPPPEFRPFLLLLLIFFVCLDLFFARNEE